MVFVEHIYKCSGCGKELDGFGIGPLPVRVRDDTRITEGKVDEYLFCDMKCLKRWARKLK